MDEAHFRADADLRGIWVLKREPALVDSSSPRLKEKVVYYSAVCLETGEIDDVEVDGNCTAETSTAFLRQLRARHPEPLFIIWDNGPAHRGDLLRSYLAPPALNLRLVPLPGDSPDDNADEAIWAWIRDDVTANTCLGTKAKVREKVGAFLHGPRSRAEDGKRRCRTGLQAQADALPTTTSELIPAPQHGDPTLALLWCDEHGHRQKAHDAMDVHYLSFSFAILWRTHQGRLTASSPNYRGSEILNGRQDWSRPFQGTGPERFSLRCVGLNWCPDSE